MQTKTFVGNNGPYLTVYTLLRLGTVSICIHHFYRGDEERDCHDHPFSFLSVILRGRYREHRYDGTWTDRGVLSIVFRSALHRHRIELLRMPCWTLCVKRSVGREWGFWPDRGFVPWREYIRSKGLTPLEQENIMITPDWITYVPRPKRRPLWLRVLRSIQGLCGGREPG